MKTVFEIIKDRLPITEVLSSYLTLQQSGSQYKAKCPFHNERTASFHISPERGLYYCFGCGAKGDIFTFVEQFEGLDKKGALKLLADRAGVVLTNNPISLPTDGLYEILEKATLIYQNILKENKDALEYLEKRGVTKETIASFRIGYAPDEWRTIDNTCKDKKEKELALLAGLTKEAGGKIFDRFRRRIMFPLSDSSGRIIGFSGRIFPQSDDGPKYLNSPETQVFEKSKTLFGFDKAKSHIKKHNFAILVEGQMDLIISHQAGFKNTVASSGTAVSEDAAGDPFSNLSVLSRLTSNLFMAFDGDSAGQKAMDRAALVALSLGMNPKVVVLPESVDPAEFIIKEGVDAWKDRLKESKHFIEHHLNLIKKQSLSPHVFVKTVREKIFPFLARVSSSMERSLYLKKIGEELDMKVEVIEEELKKIIKPQEKSQIENQKVFSKSTEITTYERLTALRKNFTSEEIEKNVEFLSSLSIGDMVFSANPVPDETLERALVLVEKDYGSLDNKTRALIAKELAEKIAQEFLSEARLVYSRELKKAESEQNEDEIHRLSSLLLEIAKRKHVSLPT